MCSSLFSCSTVHELSVLHAEEGAAMSRNVVKRLANPISINSLLDVIGQSDNYVIDIFFIFFYRAEYMLRVQKTVKERRREDVFWFRP